MRNVKSRLGRPNGKSANRFSGKHLRLVVSGGRADRCTRLYSVTYIMPYVRDGAVVSRRTPWRFSIVTDVFWSVVNLVAALYVTSRSPHFLVLRGFLSVAHLSPESHLTLPSPHPHSFQSMLDPEYAESYGSKQAQKRRGGFGGSGGGGGGMGGPGGGIGRPGGNVHGASRIRGLDHSAPQMGG